MTKGEIAAQDKFLSSKYVEAFDTALPQDYLDYVVIQVIDKLNLDPNKVPYVLVYRAILFNCVYVYTNGSQSFLYCITNDAIAQFAVNLMYTNSFMPKALIEYTAEVNK